MKVTVHKNRNGEYKVKFSQGVQTFELDYYPTEKDEAEWVAERLRDAFNAFADEVTKGIANDRKGHCTCEFPIIRTMEKRSIAGTAKRILI